MSELASSWTDDPESVTPTYRSVDEMLSAAREGLTRLTPAQAVAAAAEGALIVDIRPIWQREVEGLRNLVGERVFARLFACETNL